MLEIDNAPLVFRTKTVWFSEYPFDVDDADSITFLSCQNRIDGKGFKMRETPTLVMDLTQGPDEIWSKMHKTMVRSQIKRGEKQGIQVFIDQDYEQFLDLYRTFRELKGLPKYDFSIEFMKKYGRLFVARLGDEVLGGIFCLEDGDYMLALIAATKRLEDVERRSMMANANRMLIWEGMKYGAMNGMSRFDFGGYYLGNQPDDQKERINDFKKRFGGELKINYDYRKDYSTLIKTIRRVLDFTRRNGNRSEEAW